VGVFFDKNYTFIFESKHQTLLNLWT
jgi:hypothetical protein